MKRAWDKISYKSLYFVNRPLRVRLIGKSGFRFSKSKSGFPNRTRNPKTDFTSEKSVLRVDFNYEIQIRIFLISLSVVRLGNPKKDLLNCSRERAEDKIEFKSPYFVNRPLRLQKSGTFSQNRFCRVRSAGLIDIFAQSTWAVGRVSLSSLTLRFHPDFRPSDAQVHVHRRVYVYIIYEKTKDKFLHCLT